MRRGNWGENLQLQQEISERKKAGAELQNLERTVKAFTGREVRMIELKEQIAKLEKNAELDKKAGDKTT